MAGYVITGWEEIEVENTWKLARKQMLSCEAKIEEKESAVNSEFEEEWSDNFFSVDLLRGLVVEN